MELRWGHLCAAAQFAELAATLTGIMSGVRAGGYGGEAPFPITVALRIYASAADGLDNHVLQVRLRDVQGATIGEPVQELMPFTQMPPGYPMPTGANIRLDRWPLLEAGEYTFECAVDAKPLGEVPLTIYPAAGGGRAGPQQQGPTPHLIWAHYVQGFEFLGTAGRPGSLMLKDIMEFAPTSRGERLRSMGGSTLLLHIEAGTPEQTGSPLRVELLDANGEPIMPPYRQPITLRPAAENLFVSTVPVRFRDDLVLPPEDYQFRFYLNERPFGEPLDLTILLAV